MPAKQRMPDPSLEGLDDIDGPVDDGWAKAVRAISKMRNEKMSDDIAKMKALLEKRKDFKGHKGRFGKVGGSLPKGRGSAVKRPNPPSMVGDVDRTGKISKVKVWIAPPGHRFAGERRIYIETVDGRTGCYYSTGNTFNAKGIYEGTATPDDWKEARRVAISPVTKKFVNYSMETEKPQIQENQNEIYVGSEEDKQLIAQFNKVHDEEYLPALARMQKLGLENYSPTMIPQGSGGSAVEEFVRVVQHNWPVPEGREIVQFPTMGDLRFYRLSSEEMQAYADYHDKLALSNSLFEPAREAGRREAIRNGKVMISKYSGTSSFSGKPFKAGDTILYAKARGETLIALLGEVLNQVRPASLEFSEYNDELESGHTHAEARRAVDRGAYRRSPKIGES